MFTLILLAACSTPSTDTSGSKDTDTGGDTAGDDTDTGGDTTDTGGDTTDTVVDTTDTTDTTDTGDTGPPDDGGPATKADCSADWVESITEGDSTGHRTFDADENQLTEVVQLASGATSDSAWTYDETGCMIQSIVSVDDKDGAHTRVESNYSCDENGYAVQALVISEVPGDGAPTITTLEFRFGNGFDDQDRLIQTATYRIEEDATETLVNTVHYYYNTDGELFTQATDVDNDGTDDMSVTYLYDDLGRVIQAGSDRDADGVLDSATRSIYNGESDREYHIETINPEDATIISVKEFTWTCP